MARLTRMLLLALLACTLGALPASASHLRCGDTITEDTTLDSDLVDCAGDGIVIGGDGVTLDLGGHRIDAANGAENGVAIRSRADTEVRNGTISGFRFGVLGEEADGVRLAQLSLERNETAADLFFSRGLNEVLNVEAKDGSVGLNLDGPIHVARSEIVRNSFAGIVLDYTGGTIEDSTIARNGLGIELEEAYALIRNNRILDNAGSGIEYGYWQDGDVVGNTISGNDIGIRDRGTSHVTISQNLLRANERYGALVNGLAPITANRVSWNGVGLLVRDHGTGTGGSGPCLVARNAAYRNGAHGIEVKGLGGDDPGCDSTRVASNHLHHNGDDGLLVTNTGRDTAIVANRAERNGDDGIDVDGAFGDDVEPAWSPDGRQLAFRSDRVGSNGLYVVGVDGRGLHRLGDGRSPDWSPDGQRIAFAAADGVRVIAPDGSGERLLAAGTVPQWSPDGTEILLQAGRDLRIVDVATGAVRALARGLDAEWSPDGSKIAFSGIATINRDGSAGTEIATGSAPSWSPDATRITFTDGYDIVTVAPDGADPRYVTLDEPSDSRPRWSPRGDLIAFNRADDPAGTYLVEPDGARLRFVSAHRDGVWSPDGTSLAFAGLEIKDVETGEWTTVGNDTNTLVTLSRNHANANIDLGIEAGTGVTDGGGNRAAGNGDPGQCAGVSCKP